MASSSTGTLPEEGPWVQLPEELLLKVLDELRWTRRDSGAVRGVCRRWRTAHDAGCKTLWVRNDVTEEVTCALCGRMPALTSLNLTGVQSLNTEGLSAVGGLAALTWLDLTYCSNVTDVGLQELTSLTALSHVLLYGSFTTKIGRDALKAAIPGLRIHPSFLPVGAL
jgi:hypothetical protein